MLPGFLRTLSALILLFLQGLYGGSGEFDKSLSLSQKGMISRFEWTIRVEIAGESCQT